MAEAGAQPIAMAAKQSTLVTRTFPIGLTVAWAAARAAATSTTSTARARPGTTTTAPSFGIIGDQSCKTGNQRCAEKAAFHCFVPSLPVYGFTFPF